MKRSSHEAGLDPETLQYSFRASDDVDAQQLINSIIKLDNPDSWWNVILAVPIECFEVRAILYKRAVAHLPDNQELWAGYLKEARSFVKQFSIVED
jgi:hypothetical protein